MSVVLDPEDTNYVNTIMALQPVPGTYIFIDICNSTSIKQKGSKKWIYFIGNTFTIIRNVFSFFEWNLVKYIGDEIMLFIPDSSATRKRLDYNQTFDELKVAVRDKFYNDIDKITLRAKAAIHYCTDVFNFSFHEGSNDYYGRDVDFTARLMSKAAEGKIIVSKEYLAMLRTAGSAYVPSIKGPFLEQFKGFPGYSEYFLYE
jgi:class 3 adenylate cyclase